MARMHGRLIIALQFEIGCCQIEPLQWRRQTAGFGQSVDLSNRPIVGRLAGLRYSLDSALSVLPDGERDTAEIPADPGESARGEPAK